MELIDRKLAIKAIQNDLLESVYYTKEDAVDCINSIPTKEFTLEEVENIITSKPMSQGGISKHFWTDCFLPYIELIQKHLATENIKMIFIKDEVEL